MVQKWISLLTTVTICVALFLVSYVVEKKHFIKDDNIVNFAFVVYLFGVIYLTILSRAGVNDRFSMDILRWEKNLIAFFRELQKSIKAWRINGHWPGIYYGDYYVAMINEGLANIVLFVPLGFFFGKRKVCELHGLTKCLVLGFACSIIIELLQFLMVRGTFDLEDIINNTVGFAVGFWWWKWLVQRFIAERN